MDVLQFVPKPFLGVLSGLIGKLDPAHVGGLFHPLGHVYPSVERLYPLDEFFLPQDFVQEGDGQRAFLQVDGSPFAVALQAVDEWSALLDQGILRVERLPQHPPDIDGFLSGHPPGHAFLHPGGEEFHGESQFFP